MGNENSNDDFRDNSLIDSDLDVITYKGKRIMSFDEEGNAEDEDSQKINLEKEKEEKNTVPVIFRWDDGGNNVYVTGSFCNWGQFFLMKKNSEGVYELKLDLPKCRFEYKFKVDGEWKCNKKYPTCINENNENNYLDTTYWEISIEKSEETENSTTELSVLHSRGTKSVVSNSEFEKYKNIYSTCIPKIDEMNTETPSVPNLYNNTFNLDINEKQIKLKKLNDNDYYEEKEQNLLSDNYSYKKLDNVCPEQINHLITNLKNNDNQKLDKKYSFISRYRLKFTNFVYYK